MPLDHEHGDSCKVCGSYWEPVRRVPVKDEAGSFTPFYPLCDTHSKELKEKGFVVISTVQKKGQKIYKA